MDEELQNHINQLLKIQDEVNEVRMEGESYINDLQANNCYDLLRLSCSLILSDQEIPTTIIQLSFILINRNRLFVMNNWTDLTPDQQATLMTAATRGLFFQDQVIRSLSSLTFCLIAKCGINVFQQDLFKNLSIPICNTEYEPCCTIGTFMALKELVIQEDIIQDDFPFYQELGQTVIDAFEKIMGDPEVFELCDFIEFLKCYSIILPFFQQFYYNDESLKSFLNLVSNVLHINNADIHLELYNLLFSFFKCFYEHIIICMDLIFEMTVNSLNMVDFPDFIAAAINFWKNVALFEIPLYEKCKSGKNVVFLNITGDAAPNLIDLLMLIATRFAPESIQPSLELESIERMNSKSVCQDAVDCLREFSCLSGNVFSKLSSEFDERIASTDWHDRVAAIYSLWCISRSSEYLNMFELNQFYENRFMTLIQLSNDPVEVVRIEALSFLAALFRVDYLISGKQFFLKNIVSYLNQIVFGLKRMFISGKIESVSDIIYGRICDIILEIGISNKVKRDDNDIVYRNHMFKKKKSAVPEQHEELKKDQLVEEEEEMEGDTENEEDIYKIIGCENPQTIFSFYFFKFLRILFNIFDFPIFQSKSYIDLQEKCTQVINTMFLATPIKQVGPVLQFYLPIIFSKIDFQLSIFSNPPSDENIDCAIRIRQLCYILYSIIDRAGAGINEFSETILSFLIKLLMMKNVLIHEEALMCLVLIVKINAQSILDCFPQIMDLFFTSQDCQNDIVVRESAKLLSYIFSNIENSSSLIDQATLKKIFDVFINNLKDDELSLDSRLMIVKVFGIIIKITKIASEPFFLSYAEALSNYQSISFSFLVEEEAEEASKLYSTIFDGYGYLLEASEGLDFFNDYVKNLPSIIQFLDSIGKYGKCLDNVLKRSIINYIKILFHYFPAMKGFSYYRMLRSLINKKIKPVLKVLKEDEDANIVNEASTQLRYLKGI